MSRALLAFEWLQEKPDRLQVAPQGPPDTPGMAPVTEYISRLNTEFSLVRKYGYWVEIKYGQKVLNPEMDQKVRFWNEDGHEIDNCLTIRPENRRSHINFFVRIQP